MTARKKDLKFYSEGLIKNLSKWWKLSRRDDSYKRSNILFKNFDHEFVESV